MKRTSIAAQIALGGLMAALALVIMSLGGLIPIATYVSPMLCMIIFSFSMQYCSGKIRWAWYAAVSILSMLLSPDKETAAVFVFLGYYPIIKPKIDSLPLRWVWKLLLFNASVCIMYWILMKLMGMNHLSEEFLVLGTWGLILMLIMGNLIFVLLDRLLGMHLFRR